MDEDSLDVLRPVLHILVVGFHHQRGAEVEFAYPEFKEGNLRKGLPIPWTPLLHNALPDGVHNYEGDYTFFHLPQLTKNNSEKNQSKKVFGVACFQQIPSKELKVKSHDVTRASVQKSVVIVLQKPLFGFILTKLKLVTQAYFNEKDFSQVAILKDTYFALNNSLSTSKIKAQIYFTGLSVGDLVLELKQKVVVLVKLLLLEKKVVFWGSPVGHVCATMMSLFSLYPDFFHNWTLGHVTQGKTDPPTDPAKSDPHGLPLELFGEDYVLYPYLSMQEMNEVKQFKGFVIGTSNVLFKHQSHLQWDALVDLEKKEVLIPDGDTSRRLALTTEDLRFSEFLLSSVADYRKESGIGWDGSDEWIRLQFKYYILCLLASTAPEKGNSEHIHSQFNAEFIQNWKSTNCYHKWCHTAHPGLDDIHQGHPFEGGLTISDVKLRIKSQINALSISEDSREKIGAAVQKTSQVVGGALNSARNTLSSWRNWITGIMEEINEEMSSNSVNVELVNSNNKEVDLNSDELNHAMLIREEKAGAD